MKRIATLAQLFPVSLVWLVGCSAAVHHRPSSAPAGMPPKLVAPFTETLPRSTVTLVLRPIPAGKLTLIDQRTGASTETAIPQFWICETEVTWDAYDVFLLRLDVPEGLRTGADADTGPDSITRPTPPY